MLSVNNTEFTKAEKNDETSSVEINIEVNFYFRKDGAGLIHILPLFENHF